MGFTAIEHILHNLVLNVVHSGLALIGYAPRDKEYIEEFLHSCYMPEFRIPFFVPDPEIVEYKGVLRLGLY
jgi:hypothetical protein